MLMLDVRCFIGQNDNSLQLKIFVETISLLHVPCLHETRRPTRACGPYYPLLSRSSCYATSDHRGLSHCDDFVLRWMSSSELQTHCLSITPTQKHVFSLIGR